MAVVSTGGGGFRAGEGVRQTFSAQWSQRERKKEDEEEKMLAVLSLAFFHLPPPNVSKCSTAAVT